MRNTEAVFELSCFKLKVDYEVCMPRKILSHLVDFFGFSHYCAEMDIKPKHTNRF